MTNVPEEAVRVAAEKLREGLYAQFEYAHRAAMARAVLTAVVDAGLLSEPGDGFTTVGPDPAPAPPADDLDGCPMCYCDPCECRPIIGNCSKCGDVREDEYTCRGGGHTVLKDVPE
jgi:hypothetical protein